MTAGFDALRDDGIDPSSLKPQRLLDGGRRRQDLRTPGFNPREQTFWRQAEVKAADRRLEGLQHIRRGRAESSPRRRRGRIGEIDSVLLEVGRQQLAPCSFPLEVRLGSGVTKEIHVVGLVGARANGGQLRPHGVQRQKRAGQRTQSADLGHRDRQLAALKACHRRLHHWKFHTEQFSQAHGTSACVHSSGRIDKRSAVFCDGWMTKSIQVRTVSAIGDGEIRELSEVLIDCVEGGASVSFMLPITRATADAFWQNVAGSVARGERVLLIAEDSAGRIMGTVQIVFAEAENQPHRADIAKMLVHRRARKRGVGAALLAAAEEAALKAGRTVLVLDTASDAAERLYARLGWQRCGVIPGYALLPGGGLCNTTFFYRTLSNGR